MVLCCNLIGAYESKICEDNFGSCKKSFSRLGHNVNKKIDSYGRDADDSGTSRSGKTYCYRI